jgi:PAS domain S-box-containing protein
MRSSVQGSIVVDLKGRIAFASSFFCELVLVKDKRIPGMSFFDFVFPADVESVKMRFEAGKSPEALPFVLKLRRVDGTQAWSAIQAQPLQTASGEVYGISVTIASVVGPVPDQSDRSRVSSSAE